ncbi:putative phage protein [Ralstonia solanacearum CMR15]|nr:putative phage protein [Ralstonia solanacearum CMR15]
MSDLVLQLGSFQFQRQEIPESIPFGGEQRLAVHDLVGGTRVVDAMGGFTAPIQWSGWLLGQSALSRARQLDAMRAAGATQVLQWSELVFAVVVRSFRADFQRWYQMPYQITCEVVEDLTLSTAGTSLPSVDNLISSDLSTASGLMSSITDSTLGGLFTTMQSAIQGVSSFANAAQSTLNGVLQPISAFMTQAQTLIANTNNTLVNVTTLGGILPNNPVSTQVSQLSSQLLAAQQLPTLVQLDRVVGRIQGNIGSIYQSAKQVTVAGGNLMNMAAKEYGDPLAWTGIAKANPQLGGDPQISGIQTVTIPPSKDTVGGLLNS